MRPSTRCANCAASLHLEMGVVRLADCCGPSFDRFEFGITWVTLTDLPQVGVPGPLAGAGLSGLVFAGSGFLAWWRRKWAAFRCSRSLTSN
jgi:hypothetical protein